MPRPPDSDSLGILAFESAKADSERVPSHALEGNLSPVPKDRFFHRIVPETKAKIVPPLASLVSRYKSIY